MVTKKDTVDSVLKKELTEEQYMQAITYADKVILTHTPYSRSQALRWAFDWKDTPEGFAYWERLHDQLWVKDRLSKKISKIRKGVMVCAIIIFIVCMYKIIML
jgi:hypothetical protein